MSGRFWILATAFGLAGCCGPEQRASLFPGNPPCNSCGASALPPGSRLTPYPTDPAAGSAIILPPSTPTQLPPITPPPSVSDTGGPVGRSDPAFRPAIDAQARLGGPQRYIPESADAQVLLDKPIPVQTDAKPLVPQPAPPASSDRIARAELPPTADPPVDIPGFVIVRAKVATGQQPFPDGIAWLQTKGYRTVLHLRAPGEAGTAARRKYEERGIQYISLEVAPDRLTRDLAEQFDRIVKDETNLPLFVWDRDGGLAGSLWYLHFRLNGLTDEKALAETTRLGFRLEQDDDHKALFNAARAILVAPQP